MSDGAGQILGAAAVVAGGILLAKNLAKPASGSKPTSSPGVHVSIGAQPDNSKISSITGDILQTDVMSPQAAYQYIRQGLYASKVRTAPMSVYYSWGDFFKTENPKDGELAAMTNGARHARNLDILCDRLGYRKVAIASWYRSKAHQLRVYAGRSNVPLNSRHIIGDGTDISGSESYLKKTVLPVARGISQFGGIGVGDPGVAVLHIDSRPLVANARLEFIDNGTIQRDFRTVIV